MKRWDGAFWAEDTFAKGGDLVDAGGPFAAKDKVQHGVGFAALWLLLAFLPWFWVRVVAWWTVSISVEVLEAVRLLRWWRAHQWARDRGWVWSWKDWRWTNTRTTIVGPVPVGPPALADRPSWRDLLANLAGLVVAGAYLWLLRGAP